MGTGLPLVETPDNKPVPKKRPPRVRSATPSKRKPAAKLNMKNMNRKRKKGPSESDFSDFDNDPPPPKKEEEDEDDPNKRRSGKNTGSRKKYIDEPILNLSDDNMPE